MARKAKQPSAEDILKQMYPDIMTSDDYVKTDDPAKQAQDKQPAPEVAALQAELAALREQVASQNRSTSALLTQSPANNIPPQMPQIDWTKAPNPVDDPEGFARFNAQATQMLLNWKEQEFEWKQSQAQTASRRNDNLWETFSDKYKDYASHTDRVEFAARKVVERAAAKGQDVDKYMYGNSEGFFSDVVKEMDRVFGKPNDVLEVGGDEGDEEEDDNRTAMFGGAASSGKPAAATTEPPQRYGLLSQEVMAWQEKTGFKR